MNAQSLKPKHVEALVKHWREEGISTRAIKNRKGKKCLTKKMLKLRSNFVPNEKGGATRRAHS